MRRSGRHLLPFLLCLAGVGLTWWAVPRLQRDTSLAQLFPTDGAVRQRFAEFDRAFGTDDVLLVVVRDRAPTPVFRPDFVRYLDGLVATLEAEEGVEKVVCLANMLDLTVVDARLPPLPRPLLPARRDRITAAAGEALDDHPLTRGLLSFDGTACACWILLDPELRSRRDYLTRTEQIAAHVPVPGDRRIEVVTTGFPLLQGAVIDLLWRDGARLLLLALVVLTLTATAGGVPWRASLGYLLSWPAVAGAVALWAWARDLPLGAFGNTVLPLLMITSGGSFVHWGRALRADRGHRRTTLRACVLATATTAAGFGTLASSGLAPLAVLGELVAVGAVIAFPLGALCAASLFPPATGPRPPATPRPLPRSRLVLAAAVVLAIPWFALDPGRLGSLGDVTRILPDTDPRTLDAERAAALLGAQTVLEVVVKVPPERVVTRELILGLEPFERALRSVGGHEIPFVLSPVTLLRYLDQQLAGHDAAARDAVAPETADYALRHIVRPYVEHFRHRDDAGGDGLLGVFTEWMRHLLSREGNQLRFGCRIPHLAPDAVRALVARLERQVFRPFTQTLGAERIYATGYAVLVSEAAAEVRATQVRALWLGSAVLATLLLLIVRSLRTWIVAVAINALTVVSMASFLWLTGTSLDLYSGVLTASVLGVLVDDTIHILWFHRDARGDPDPVASALARAGPSIRLSSLCLAAGFATFLLSELPDYRQFGRNAIAGVALALFWDLAVLPRVLAWRRRRATA